MLDSRAWDDYEEFQSIEHSELRRRLGDNGQMGRPKPKKSLMSVVGEGAGELGGSDEVDVGALLYWATMAIPRTSRTRLRIRR